MLVYGLIRTTAPGFRQDARYVTGPEPIDLPITMMSDSNKLLKLARMKS